MSGYFLTQSVFSIFNLRLGVLHYLLPQFIPDSLSSSLPQKNICGYYYLLGLDLAAALLCPIVTRYVLFFFFFLFFPREYQYNEGKEWLLHRQ